MEQQGQSAVNPWVIAMTVMLATFMEVLDTSVANVALPHIAGNLSAGVDESTWVLTSYLVSNAIILPLSGWFSSLFGRKRFYLGCVILFTLSSIMCGLAPNLGTLVFFRILQGLGGGGLQPVSQAILVESFPKKKHGLAMAIYGMGVVVAPIIGPTLGGWITDNYSWRWIFLINIPVGFLAVSLVTALLVDPPYLVRKNWRKERIDYMGLGLLAIGLGCLQVVLDKGQREDWFGSHFILGFSIIAVSALVLGFFWEFFHDAPVIELRLFKDRNFLVATFTMFMLGFMLYGSIVLLPIFLQTLMGYTALLSGLVLSPGGLVVLIMMPLVGWLLIKFEARWLIIVGIAVSSLSLFQMARFNLQISFSDAMYARLVQGFGLAFLFVPINTAAFYFIPKEKSGNAAGLINLARNIGGSFGIAFVTTLLSRRTQFHQNVLVSHVTPFHDAYQQMMHEARQMLVQQGIHAVEAANSASALIYQLVQRQAHMMAFIDDFWILGVMFILLIPFMFLLRRTKPQQKELPAP